MGTPNATQIWRLVQRVTLSTTDVHGMRRMGITSANGLTSVVLRTDLIPAAIPERGGYLVEATCQRHSGCDFQRTCLHPSRFRRMSEAGVQAGSQEVTGLPTKVKSHLHGSMSAKACTPNN